LGLFFGTADGVPSFISGLAEASLYDFIYRGGSLTGTPTCYTLPPGFFAKFNNGVNSTDLSTSPVGLSCHTTEQIVEGLVPIGKSDSVLHAAGSLTIEWSGVGGLSRGDSAPAWEVIQHTGLITQPASFRIRGFLALVGPGLAPPPFLNADQPGCESFLEVSYPPETDPDKVQWDGSWTQGIGHTRTYTNTEFLDKILGPQFQLITGERLALNDSELGEVRVWGPVTEGQLQMEYVGLPDVGAGDVFPPGPLYWALVIKQGANATIPFWVGVKNFGATPIGNYHRVGSVCPFASTECMYLEAGENPIV